MSRWHVRVARDVLRAGGVIAYPTEAVFGLGCDPWNFEAVQEILRLKGRSADKGLVVIAAGFEQLLPLIERPSAEVLARLEASWPGFVTWVLPSRPETPTWLTGRHLGLAVRVTAHPLAAALCRAFERPLVSTSANPGGFKPARTNLTVHRYFGDALDFIVPGAVGGQVCASEIRDARTGEILRAGKSKR